MIEPDGALADVTLESGRLLEGLYRVIGCRVVDVVRLSGTRDMWLDNEGMFGGVVNGPATRLARWHGFTWQPSLMRSAGASLGGSGQQRPAGQHSLSLAPHEEAY